MSTVSTAPTTNTLPKVAWILGWLLLAGQVIQLASRGTNPNDLVVVSMLLSAAITWWLADGVLRARMVRLALVWVGLSAATVLIFLVLVIEPVEATAVDIVTFALTLAELIALGVFCTTDYFKHRRAYPSASRDALTPLLLMAVTIGLLGGMIAPSGNDGTTEQVRINL